MWIREVARCVNLVWFDLPQQFHDHRDVCLAERLLFHASGFVEGHVHKVEPLVRQAAASAGRSGFAAADHSLDRLYFRTINLSWLFVTQKLLDMRLELCGAFRR